jgi:hypothetical protein
MNCSLFIMVMKEMMSMEVRATGSVFGSGSLPILTVFRYVSCILCFYIAQS